MGYGFSLLDNASDHYSLGFSPAIVAYVRAAKARRLAPKKPTSGALQSQSTRETSSISPKLIGGTFRNGGQVLESLEDLNVEEILKQNIHWVRLLENENYEFSPRFLEDFSIAVENSREARIADDISESETRLLDRGLSRNKLHVICAVIMILQKGQRAIRKYSKDLPKAPQNSKQVDAARYRDSQLKILDSVLDSLCKFLRSVTVNSPEASDPRVVRLEQIFTESPKSLLKDVRGVLNAGLRTRDPRKIRERRGGDFAFTIWLCGLWVYPQSDSRGEDEISQKYLRWLHFLQHNYATPSEESIDQPRPENPVLAERAEWFDPVRSASGDAETDSAFIARSYLDAVRAATEKRPQSVYNDGRITVRRIEWCLNIIKNEGVWCPNLDQGDDEEADDWVIFLELGDS
ncbi:MAG: hypothetical protein ASARMPREDX12_000417 [Alectoria sarmentosa]|nr:MAG: hypothetical protein ASARMPREDX12_000417 [Alectoria sarmentosa]CAD6589797.1 MAG: hypothetical protein ASARMPRED_004271 [Alectoria sarmentosa]